MNMIDGQAERTITLFGKIMGRGVGCVLFPHPIPTVILLPRASATFLLLRDIARLTQPLLFIDCEMNGGRFSP